MASYSAKVWGITPVNWTTLSDPFTWRSRSSGGINTPQMEYQGVTLGEGADEYFVDQNGRLVGPSFYSSYWRAWYFPIVAAQNGDTLTVTGGDSAGRSATYNGTIWELDPTSTNNGPDDGPTAQNRGANMAVQGIIYYRDGQGKDATTQHNIVATDNATALTQLESLASAIVTYIRGEIRKVLLTVSQFSAYVPAAGITNNIPTDDADCRRKVKVVVATADGIQSTWSIPARTDESIAAGEQTAVPALVAAIQTLLDSGNYVNEKGAVLTNVVSATEDYVAN